MIDYQEARKIAGMLAAVGEPTRMLILHRLTRGPHFVGQLSELIGIPMVNMSHHLGVMRQAGILEDRKDGRRVVYSFRSEIYTPGAGDEPGILQFGAFRMVLSKPAEGSDGDKRALSRKKAVRKKDEEGNAEGE